MPTWGTAAARKSGPLAGLALLVVFALPSAAGAAARPAHATIADCKDDHMTVAGAVKLRGRAARRARGAVLQLRFRAMPLFGLPHSGAWRTLGKKTEGSAQEVFGGLGAETWSGVMSWRFKKGRRTVASGNERAQPGRVGRVRGGAFCTLSEGAKPPDTTPPQIYVLPVDEVWHRAPFPVLVSAIDDFTGVRSVTYSADGGPEITVPNNSTFTLEGEGARNVHLTATDVAGNTATRDVVVRVDNAAPTKPRLTAPFSVTVSTTPSFSWTQSTDSGSGMRGYFLQIKRTDGSVVSFTPIAGGTTTSASGPQLNDGETYVASVIAIDNTDVAFSAESDPLTFRVDSQPGISGSTPGNGAIVSGAAKDANLTVTLDRPADKSTVAASTVKLAGVDPTRDLTDAYTVSCDSSCTTITINPDSTLAEGRYTITLNGVKSQESVAIPGTVAFAVPFRENDSATAVAPPGCIGGQSTILGPYSVPTNATAERGRFTFDWAFSDAARSWTATVMAGGNSIGGSSGSGSSGHTSFDFDLGSKGSGTNQITLEFTVDCVSGNDLDITNVLGTRLP
jgi:hypothetical protein